MQMTAHLRGWHMNVASARAGFDGVEGMTEDCC